MAFDTVRSMQSRATALYITLNTGGAIRFIRREGDDIIGMMMGKEVRVHKRDCVWASDSRFNGEKKRSPR